MKSAIFQKISDPRDAEKFQKNGKVTQNLYFARNNLKSLKICSKHYLYSL